jgi:hypothetical protein
MKRGTEGWGDLPYFDRGHEGIEGRKCRERREKMAGRGGELQKLLYLSCYITLREITAF